MEGTHVSSGFWVQEPPAPLISQLCIKRELARRVEEGSLPQCSLLTVLTALCEAAVVPPLLWGWACLTGHARAAAGALAWPDRCQCAYSFLETRRLGFPCSSPLPLCRWKAWGRPVWAPWPPVSHLQATGDENWIAAWLPSGHLRSRLCLGGTEKEKVF